jgi:hypothetical protein
MSRGHVKMLVGVLQHQQQSDEDDIEDSSVVFGGGNGVVWYRVCFYKMAPVPSVDATKLGVKARDLLPFPKSRISLPAGQPTARFPARRHRAVQPWPWTKAAPGALRSFAVLDCTGGHGLQSVKVRWSFRPVCV